MAASARTRLRNKLLRIGGVDVDFIEDPYLQVIADAGAPFANTEVRITRGRPNECHRNAALSWLKGKCDAIAIGYYLGPDSVWRQHSWGVMDDGTILDTHSGGRKYFGLRLTSIEASKFAESHVSLPEVLRIMKANPERFRPIIEECRKMLTRSDWALGKADCLRCSRLGQRCCSDAVRLVEMPLQVISPNRTRALRTLDKARSCTRTRCTARRFRRSEG